jgi:nitroreductase
MNKTLDLLINRASCRVFKNKKVPAAVLNLILEAGVHAPTGGNLQPWSIIKVEKPASKAKLAHICEDQNFMASAPLNLVFCIDQHRLKRWAALETAPFTADAAVRPFWIAFQDTVICAQNICTAADALGLGSVYIGPVFDRLTDIRKFCRLPKDVIPVVAVTLGYPAVRHAPRRRLGTDVVVHSEVYKELPDKALLAAFEEKYKNSRTEINTKDLRDIERACKAVHSAKFSARCLAEIKARGYINRAQLYIGLHYRADRMLASNARMIKALRAAGLTCFK